MIRRVAVALRRQSAGLCRRGRTHRARRLRVSNRLALLRRPLSAADRAGRRAGGRPADHGGPAPLLRPDASAGNPLRSARRRCGRRAPAGVTSAAATNNFGFTSTRDYPVARGNDRQLLVGIFGGSVAAWFCQVGVPRLASELTASAAFRGREVVPALLRARGLQAAAAAADPELLPARSGRHWTSSSTSTASTKWPCRHSTTRAGRTSRCRASCTWTRSWGCSISRR